MKKTKKASDFLITTSHQKVLSFLCNNAPGEYYDAQIAREIGDLSKASANNALRDLQSTGILKRRYLGNIALNSVDTRNPLLKQYKILINITLLSGLLDEIKDLSKEIIMFGVSATGENQTEDLIDLFIVTEKVKSVEKIIENNSLKSSLHLIVHTPRQVEMFQAEAPMFFENILRGIKLF